MLQHAGTVAEVIASLNGVPADLFPMRVGLLALGRKRYRPAKVRHLHLTTVVEVVDHVLVTAWSEVSYRTTDFQIDTDPQVVIF